MEANQHPAAACQALPSETACGTTTFFDSVRKYGASMEIKNSDMKPLMNSAIATRPPR